MRSIVYAVLLSMIIIGGIEYGYQVTGGLPSVIPGKTPLELQWKITQARSAKAIYFVGDSRVDWGVADTLINKVFREKYGIDVHAVNAGLSGGSVSKITKFILDNHPHKTPGILVINYSPASFYHFNTSPGQVMRNLKRQDYFDHRIANYLVERLFTYGRTPVYLFKHFRYYAENGYTKQFGWFSRTLFPEGFVNAVGGYNDGSLRIPDLSYYHIIFDMIRKNPGPYDMKKKEIKSVIRDAEVQGWQVILTRLPVGDKMLKLEYTLPEFLHPEKIAAEMAVPFIDYEANPGIAKLPSDESHLKPDSARKMAAILAQDIVKFLVSHSEPGIKIRRATVRDAQKIRRLHGVSIHKDAGHTL